MMSSKVIGHGLFLLQAVLAVVGTFNFINGFVDVGVFYMLWVIFLELVISHPGKKEVEK